MPPAKHAKLRVSPRSAMRWTNSPPVWRSYTSMRSGICPTSLLNARAPYRWIAFLRGTEDAAAAAALLSQAPLYRDGVAGRVGVIEIVEMTGDELGANVRIAAERFPTPAYDLASAFSSTHEAQIQFGG